MKKIFDFLFSMRLAGILMIVFAGVIATATFLENDLGTIAARIFIYDSIWFELLILLMVISIVGSLIINKLYQRKKYTILIFHISFVIIVIGSGITRYFGEEGTLRIREGNSSNQIISQTSFIQLDVNDGNNQHYFSDKKLFNKYKKNRFNETYTFNNESCQLSLISYIPNAKETIIEDPGGEPIISIVFDGQNGQVSEFIKKGETVIIGSNSFSFETKIIDTSHVQIVKNEKGYFFKSPVEVSQIEMKDQKTIMLEADTLHQFQDMKFYLFGETRLVVRKFFDHAISRLVDGSDNPDVNYNDALILNLSYHNTNQQIVVFGNKGVVGRPGSATIDGVKFSLTYGSIYNKIPFSLFLRDFQLERYPGSMSPSSFASEVTLIDERYNIEQPSRIFMNNVLKYEGYRFFQSQYDIDEKGTILSVNHDYLGTFVTYIGYFLMTLGMILNFFFKGSRFRALLKNNSNTKKLALILLFVITGLFSSNSAKAQYITIDPDNYIKQSHASEFGKLMILGSADRVEPINTFASEIIRKVTKKSKLLGLNPEQIILGMLADPATWKSVPMIKITDKQLRGILGVRGNLASFDDFIDYNNGGMYKLTTYVEAAYKKGPSMRTRFDKEIIKVDERANICYMLYLGDNIKIFPTKENTNIGWYAIQDTASFYGIDKLFIINILPKYLSSVRNGLQNGNWVEAGQNLDLIKKFQQKNGSWTFPSKSKTSLEIFYNKLNIFKRLFPIYSLIGFGMLILLFVGVLNPKYKFDRLIKIGIILIITCFVFQTIGLGVRWYISGHAPWSNGYESMIYISWATIFAGLFFVKKSQITLATTVILASLTLMVANMSWMDPEITNLVPVLKSYWLVIHVAVIVASYSFLAIGCLLGFFNLVLMIFKTPKNKERINATIKELTGINEMNLIIGGFLITTGTFLGAVWANESWGRYWGWDPKETWALVTLIIYAFVIHMRLIPGLKGTYAFNFAALISFSTVLMTYFGVNYYLSGLHSYANGDPVPIPGFVYYTIVVVAIVSIWAYMKENKYKNQIPQKT
ncbi:c-type cytochrome biogenesis protein CcsB [Bacteroidota bacterium]